MPYSDAWGATIEQDVPNAGDVTMTLTSGGVICTATARTDIGAKDDLALCFNSQPGPAPRIWQARYRIARAVATRAAWQLIRNITAAGNQNRIITRDDPVTSLPVAKTAAEWVVIIDQRIAEAQADWDTRVSEARSAGFDE